MNPFDLQGTQVTNMTPGGMPPGANVPPMAPGVMSGALNIQNQRRMEEMQALQKQASMMALWEQLQKQHEYQKNQGWRDAERDAGTVKATHTAQNYGRERDAEISTKETQAEVAKKTKDTNIASTNAGNIQKVSESAIKRMENFASELDTMEFNPMTGAADFDAMAERHGIPPNHPIRAKMRGAQTPEAFQMGVKQLRQKLLQSLEHQRAVALQKIKDEADYKRSVDVANIGAAASRYGADKRAAHDNATLKEPDPQKMLARAIQQVQEANKTGDPVKIKEAMDNLNFVNRTIFHSRPTTPQLQVPFNQPGAQPSYNRPAYEDVPAPGASTAKPTHRYNPKTKQIELIQQ